MSKPHNQMYCTMKELPRYFIRTPYNGVLASQTRHDYCPQSFMIRGDVTGSDGALVTADRGQVRHHVGTVCNVDAGTCCPRLSG